MPLSPEHPSDRGSPSKDGVELDAPKPDTRFLDDELRPLSVRRIDKVRFWLGLVRDIILTIRKN